MINLKTIFGVIIAAVFIGVCYVFFENNFMSGKISGDSKTQSAQELGSAPVIESSVIDLPDSPENPPPIDEKSDLLNEASNLQMRDYSSYFEDLKEKAQE